MSSIQASDEMSELNPPEAPWSAHARAEAALRSTVTSTGSLLFLGFGNLLYAILYTQVYMNMAQFWEYIGYGAFGYGRNWHIIGWAIVTLSGFFVPINRRDIGSFIVSFTFYVLYVPCIISPFIQGFTGFYTVLASGVLLGGSFVILSLVVRTVRDRSGGDVRQVVGPQFFWLGVIAVWLFGNLFVFYVYQGNLRFASFSEVYDQRFGADLIAGSGIAGYFVGNLACAINPVIIALGLKRKSGALVVMGIASQVMMYSTSALKAIIVATMMIIAFHFLFADRSGAKTKRFFLSLLAVAAAGIFLQPFYTGGNGVANQIMSLIYMRTLTTPGVLYGTYLDFFSRYPVTHLSHIHPINWFVHYPYGDLQIGQVVGMYITPAVSIESLNVNANYLATDGIAAFGVAGILVVTAISAILFRTVTKLLERTDRQLVSTTLVAFLTYLSNVSLFTALLSYGGFLAFALLWLVPRAGVQLDRGRGWHLI